MSSCFFVRCLSLRLCAGASLVMLTALPMTAAAQTLFDDLRVDYDLPSSPSDSVSADFTGDGLPDLLYTLPNSSRVSLLINRGDGVFLPAVNLTVVNGPQGCAAGDIDGDGDQDVVVALSGASGVRKLLNDGGGSFTLGGLVATSSPPYAVTLGKYDGDSDLDIMTASDIGLQVFTNDGSANFSPGAKISLVGTSTELETEDLNNDGNPDVVAIAVAVSQGIHVLLGTGGGTFLAPVYSSVGVDPRKLDIVDFAGDSAPDIVVANSGSSQLSLHVNDGSGAFPVTTTLPVVTGATAVLGDDFDGDGDIDFFVAAIAGFQARIYQNTGGTFAAGPTYPLAGGAATVDVGDFDADGANDVAVGTTAGVSAFSGNGNGGVHAASSLADGGPVRGIVAADMNGDGLNDLVSVVEFSGSIVRVRLNDGTGGFPISHDYTSGFGPRALDIGDFDTDGDMDVALSRGGPGGAVAIYMNNGDGSLASPTVYQPGNLTDGIVAADLDGDSDLDLAVACAGASNVRALINDGTGVFVLGSTTALPSVPGGLAAGDIDDDGDMDVLAACFNTDEFAVLTNSGSASFTPAMYGTGDGPTTITVADLDGDELPEVLVPLLNDQYTRVYKNLGGGTFGPPQSILSGITSSFAAVGDLDGNGTPDIAVTAADGNRVTIVNNFGAMILVNFADYGTAVRPGPLTISDLDGNGSNDIAVGHNQGASTVVLANSIPTLLSTEVASDRRIVVEFSEPVTNGDLLASNYALSGSAKGTLTTFPDSVTAETPTSRTLTWSSGEMLDGGDATITVTGFLRDERFNSLGFMPTQTDLGGGIGYPPDAAFSTDFGAGVTVPLFQVDLDFNEPVVGFSDSEIQVTNGQIAGSVSAGGSYTLDVIADAEGPVTLTIPTDTFTDLAGNAPGADSAITVVYDITPPVLSIGTGDLTRVGPDPVEITYTASDAGIGLDQAKLFVRTQGTSVFEVVDGVDGVSGTIAFNSGEDGVYEFALSGTDLLGNGDAEPTVPTLTVVFNGDGGDFTYTEMGVNSYLYPMTNDIDVEVTITGAPSTPPTITLNRLVGDGGPATLDPARLIDERLEISGGLHGGFATITWPFDPTNAAGLVGPLETVFQVEAGSVVNQFPATIQGNAVKFGPVNSFSEWWAGNAQTNVGGWESFD